MIELIKGLYQAGSPEFSEIAEKNIQAVIHLAETEISFPDKISPRESFLYVWWPIDDGPIPDTGILNGLANLAAGFLNEGRKVLISCAAGINRSSLLSCLVMMKFLQIDAREAVELVRAKNPLALSNENFHIWLTGERVR